MYAGDERLMDLVEAATRTTQNTDAAAAWGCAGAAVLERLLMGQAAEQAVRETVQELQQQQQQRQNGGGGFERRRRRRSGSCTQSCRGLQFLNGSIGTGNMRPSPCLLQGASAD
jgi:hypothetical protein